MTSTRRRSHSLLHRRDFLATGAAFGAATLAGQGAFAQDLGPLPILRIVEAGHSLTDGVMEPLGNMINASGGRGTTLKKSTIPGSPMEWRWDHAAYLDIREPQIMAEFNLMVNTERVTLSNTLPYHRSEEMALRWFDHAWKNGNDGKGAASILYASWVNIDSGPDFDDPYHDPDGHIPVRDRYDREMVMWEQILDYVNENRPEGSPVMKMIPGPLIMAAAYDEIAAGTAPGLTEFADLYLDDIHANDMGNYLISLAHFAVIYNRDPHGLPAGVPVRGGPSQEQAAWMQDLVWQIVSTYPKAETDGSGKLDY